MKEEKGQDSFGQDKHHVQRFRRMRVHDTLKGWMASCRAGRNHEHGKWWCWCKRMKLGLQRRQAGPWRLLALWLLSKYVPIKCTHGWMTYQGHIWNHGSIRTKKKCLLCSDCRKIVTFPTHHSHNSKKGPKQNKNLWVKTCIYARALLSP